MSTNGLGTSTSGIAAMSPSAKAIARCGQDALADRPSTSLARKPGSHGARNVPGRWDGREWRRRVQAKVGEEEGTKGEMEEVASISRRNVRICELEQMNRAALSPPSSPIAAVML
jgi:hypothetical protein